MLGSASVLGDGVDMTSVGCAVVSAVGLGFGVDMTSVGCTVNCTVGAGVGDAVGLPVGDEEVGAPVLCDGDAEVGATVGEQVPGAQLHSDTPARNVDSGQPQPLKAPKAPLLMLAEWGMVTDDRLVQPPKAVVPMLVTESGMVTDDRLVQP